MTARDEVRQAHESFYAALNRVVRSDYSLMEDAWMHDDDVSTVHPMGQWAAGWEQVAATWETLSNTLSEGDVRVSDLRVFVHGDVAYTIGVEHVTFIVMGRRVQFDANTTNIYRRGDGGWKIVHHHPDKAPSAEEAIGG